PPNHPLIREVVIRRILRDRRHKPHRANQNRRKHAEQRDCPQQTGSRHVTPPPCEDSSTPPRAASRPANPPCPCRASESLPRDECLRVSESKVWATPTQPSPSTRR